MIFSELYGAYYNVLAGILQIAVSSPPLTPEDLHRIVEERAFSESLWQLEALLKNERWPLLKTDGSTALKHPPTMPLTLLQKRWLKAISLDPRLKLFCDEPLDFPGIDPLFTAADVGCYDQCQDGDPYEDENYIQNFRQILDALHRRCPLRIHSLDAAGRKRYADVMPDHLEYSEKDDKFRLQCHRGRSSMTINLARIIRVSPSDREIQPSPGKLRLPKQGQVEFELIDHRDALERVLLHFAHLEKEVRKQDALHYVVRLSYDQQDETEILIRILSFGPMLKVISPPHFVDQIRERLRRQKERPL
ncbi:MAG: WYL domain-containing protein [Bacillota bacterium]|nr:WYL domain-containing protein [Bacillota bacterium]